MTIAQLDMLTRNRQPHEEYAPRVRHTTLEAAVVQAKAAIQRALDADQRLATCTCGAASPDFEIDTRRYSRPLDAQFTLERLKRMRAVDEAVEAELFEVGA